MAVNGVISMWVNCLIAGTKVWADVPASRQAAVKKEMNERVKNEQISKADAAALMK